MAIEKIGLTIDGRIKGDRMKTLKRRLEKMESQLLQSEKFADSELEMVLSVNDNSEIEASHFRVYQDGRREPIAYPEAMQLMEHSTECDVSIID